MSHGNTDKCEPNLIPLLDLVLQLIMFFMFCANMVMEQTNVEIKLPSAIAAAPLDKGEGNPIFLNVNEQGKVLLPTTQMEDRSTLDNAVQVQSFLERRKKVEYRRKTGKDGDVPNDWKPETTVILRIDERCRFEDSYPITKACRSAGYLNVQMRAQLHQN